MKIKLFTKGSNNCRLKQLWSISDPEYLPKYEMLFMKCVVYAGLPMICVKEFLLFVANSVFPYKASYK